MSIICLIYTRRRRHGATQGASRTCDVCLDVALELVVSCHVHFTPIRGKRPRKDMACLLHTPMATHQSARTYETATCIRVYPYAWVVSS